MPSPESRQYSLPHETYDVVFDKYLLEMVVGEFGETAELENDRSARFWSWLYDYYMPANHRKHQQQERTKIMKLEVLPIDYSVDEGVITVCLQPYYDINSDEYGPECYAPILILSTEGTFTDLESDDGPQQYPIVMRDHIAKLLKSADLELPSMDDELNAILEDR